MTTGQNAGNALSDAEHRTQLRRAVIASTIGTTIEWYDFLLFSLVTGLVFAKLYFPQSDPFSGTLQAYAVFFVGFVARPVGAFIFGHYGDRIGRKAALIATLLITGLATFCVALVPTYDQIGIWGRSSWFSCASSKALGSVGSGPAPFIAAALFATYRSGYAIALYIFACGVVSMIAAALLKDYTNKDISVEYDKVSSFASTSR